MDSPVTFTQAWSEFTAPQTLRLAGTFVAVAVALTLMLHTHHQYLAFVALGPGGTPTSLPGFLRVSILGLFALPDPYSPDPASDDPADQTGFFLGPLPSRRGPRPQTRGIAPHRQVTQRADAATFEALAHAIRQLAADRDDLTEGTSCFEKHGTGLFALPQREPQSQSQPQLPSDPPHPRRRPDRHHHRRRRRRRCGGEVCHVHPSDGSMHMTLHPADVRAVLEAGWAERHPLGRGGWLERFVPAGFVMVYAPRDEGEMRQVLGIVEAAAWFVGGRGEWWGDGEERRDSGYGSGAGEVVK